MSIKQLSAEGRFECGFDDVAHGKVCAVVAVTGRHYPARLGIAIANERGYVPIPEHWANGDNLAELEAHARVLNEQLFGLTEDEELRIIASTMHRANGGNDDE